MNFRRVITLSVKSGITAFIISCSAPTETLVLRSTNNTDTAPPAVSLANMPSMLRGGVPYRVEFTLAKSSPVTISVAMGQSSYQEVGTVPEGETGFVWDVPAQNVTAAKLRLRVEGSETSLESKPFEIRAMPPVFTQTSQPTDQTTRRASLTFAGTCERDFPVTVHLVSATGALALLQTSRCSNSAWSFNRTLGADGSYSFIFAQQDPVGNRSQIASRVTKRTGAPLLTQTVAAPVSTTRVGPLVMGGNCEFGLPLLGTVAVGSQAASAITGLSCSANGTWSYTATASSDATRTYTFRQVSDTNLTATVEVNWTLKTSLPAITQTLAPASILNNLNSVTYGGACEAGLSIAFEQRVEGATDVLSRTVPCAANGTWTHIALATNDGRYLLSFSQTDIAGNTRTVSAIWARTAGLPVVVRNTLRLNNGALSTANNFLTVALNAASSVARLAKVTHFCLKYNDFVQPSAQDACFIPVNAVPSPNVPSDFQVSITGYPYPIGFLAGTYTVYAWVKDAAGNISGNPASGGASATIQYNPPRPPLITEVYAVSNPQSPLNRTASSGAPVHIFWRVTDERGLQTGLATNPVSLSVTTDHTTYTSIATAVPNAANSGCRLNHGNMLTANATGCFVWTSNVPSGQYFRIRVAARGSSGILAFGQSNAVNQGDFNFLAGNVETGEDSTATAAILRPRGNQGLVVHPSGRIFILDERGLMVVNPNDGILRRFIRTTGTARDGAVSSATFRAPNRIALDYSNNIWVRDFETIRKIDMTTMAVSTVIGGGDSSDADVSARDLKVSVEPISYSRRIFTSLPNGDLLFMAEPVDGTPQSTPSATIRWYSAANGRVTSIPIGGRTSLFGIANQDLGACSIRTAAAAFDRDNLSPNPLTHLLLMVSATSRTSGGCRQDLIYSNQRAAYAFLNPSNFSPFPSATLRSIRENGFREIMNLLVTGMNGKIYLFGPPGNFNYHSIASYDGYGNWVPEVGMSNQLVTGEAGFLNPRNTEGECADGTLRLSCAIKPNSVFVDVRGSIYFIDDNIVRTISQEGKVITLVGQRRSSGDGGRPQDSRLGTLTDVSFWHDGTSDRFLISELSHFRIREFSENGNISSIVGARGLRGDVDAGTAVYASAPKVRIGSVDYPAPQMSEVNLMWKNDASASIVAVTSTGNFYASLRPDFPLYYVNRQLGQWMPIGSKYPPYSPHPLAWDPVSNNVLVGSLQWCGDQAPDTNGGCNHKLYLADGVTGARTPVLAPRAAGTSVFASPGDWCKYPYTAAAGCTLPARAPQWSDASEFMAVNTTDTQFPRPVQDSDGGWLMKMRGSANVVKVLPSSSSNTPHRIQILTTLAKRSLGFGFNKENKHLYYCSSEDGRLYDRNTLSGTETVIVPPFPTFSCSAGEGLVQYHSRRGTVVFTYGVNGLVGIAEVAP
jgi:hypothetical protein